MLTTHPSSVFQKRDLHVGGLGSGASGALAAVTEPARDAADSWLERARDAAQEADDLCARQPMGCARRGGPGWFGCGLFTVATHLSRALDWKKLMANFDDVRRKFSNHRQWRDFIAAVHESVTYP